MSVNKIKYCSGNNASTTLSSSITDSATAAPLTSDTNFSAATGAGMVVIDEGTSAEEFAYATGKSGSSLTLPSGNRGLEGSSAVGHDSGASVKGILSATMWNDLVDGVATVVNVADGTIKKASGAEVTTGTEDAKIVTPKALKDAGIVAVTPYTYSDWQATSGLSYASADDPTFVITTATDLTGSIGVGMRLKLTQTTVKYFIVTAITSNSITVYGGTDYTLANEAITSPYFSSVKCPLGFPLDPIKWTAEVEDNSDRTQASPTNDTWYNLGSFTLAVPIGAWHLSYKVSAAMTKTSTTLGYETTLSTANNSESDDRFTCRATQNATAEFTVPTFAQNYVILASKTSYYLNTCSKAGGGAGATLYNVNSQQPAVIKAVCAYL